MHPSPETGTHAWHSEYLFFNGYIYSGECDRVVLEVMEPFVRRCQAEGWISQWFFIRYSERGFHVRLRMYGEKETLANKVVPALREHVLALHPDAVEGFPLPPYEPGQPLPPPVEHAEEELGKVTHYATVEYEPETDRYGGPQGVRLAERFFEVSSEAALSLLSKTNPRERSSRLGKGLLAMVVLVHVFRGDRDGGAEFARQYGINYLRTLVPDDERRSAWLGAFGTGFEQQAETLSMYVDEVWERMDEDESLSEALDRYHADLRGVRQSFRELFEAGKLGRPEMTFGSWEHAVGGIVSSYVHMMNNRLGVSIQEESYLAYLIVRALGKVVEVPGAAPASAPEPETAEPEAQAS